MSDFIIDDSLLELFTEEVQNNVQVLSTGLVALEQDPANATLIEPLMRAAHSIKGAARVVNVDPAVKLAHILEECLVRAQNGLLSLSAEGIDVLLKGADMLGSMGEAVGHNLQQWLATNNVQLGELSARLQSLAEGKAAADQGPVAPSQEPKPSKTSESDAAGPAADGTQSTVVRITAENLTRLMGLAGETLVEARWLQPFSRALLKLKREQTLLADTLEELQQVIDAEGANDSRNQLLDDAVKRLTECRRMVAQRLSEFENRARRTDDLNSRLYYEVIASRMRPFRDGVQGFPRMVRDLARQLGKKVTLEIRGETTDMDRDILEKLDAPLNHILRNAMDHGLELPEERLAAGKPESCQLVIEARHNAGMLVVSVSDDGRGIDLEKIRGKIIERKLADAQMARQFSNAELLDFLFLPGFTTAKGVTEVSGRGVGMDVVQTMAHSVGGNVRLQTEPGQGTTVCFELPITLSVIRAVLVKIAGEPYAFPHTRIDRLLRVPRAELSSLENRQHFQVDGRNVGVVLARQVLDLQGGPTAEDDLFVVLFSDHSGQYGLVVDDFCGEHDLVVRPLDPRLGKVPNINAVAILDDGSPVLIVDLVDLCRSIEKMLRSQRLRRADEQTTEKEGKQVKRILVVDDSITVREVQRQLLSNAGYEVELAVDGLEGFDAARQGNFDLIITDIDMPRLNGIELVRMIKQDPRLQSIPVVIVSYKDRQEDRLQGLEAGANYYLTKSSFHDETLLEAVQELIGMTGR